MEKRIKSYLKYIDEMLAKKDKLTKEELSALREEHLIQIGFFQHERLIHLIVTVLFALMEIISLFMVVVTGQVATIVLTFMILVLLAPYIRHYYILENGVQKMYSQYDEMTKKYFHE